MCILTEGPISIRIINSDKLKRKFKRKKEKKYRESK